MRTFTKTADEAIILEFEFARELESIWRPGDEYSTTTPDYVRPSAPNGFEYECTTSGQSSNKEPIWPIVVADTKADGSVIWTARAFGTNGTDTISTVAASGESGITVGSPTQDGTKVTVAVSVGTAGKDYEVSCKVTTAAGETIEEVIKVVVT